MRSSRLQPHRSKSFKISTDPFFIEKVRDVVGLYLNPPDKALVLCVDEKSQIQALERTQPVLPVGFGYLQGVTHDYYRHGTTTLFAALNLLDGSVIAQCKRRHRHQEFSSFLNHLDHNIPTGLDVHLIADNYGTHKHAKVKAWLASHPCYQIHYTPTYASWLNQVERWLVLSQAVSLYFTLTLLKFLEGTVLKEDVDDLWENFAQNLPPAQRADLGTMDRKFYAIAYAPKDYRSLDYHLDLIIRGLIRE